MRNPIAIPGVLLIAVSCCLLAPAAAAQEVNAVRPGCGAAGDPVLISGSGFFAEPGVTFGGTVAEVVRSDETRVLCRVPEGLAPGAVTVAVDGAAAADSFTVLEDGAPVVLRLGAKTATPGMPLFVIGRRLHGGEAEFVDGAGLTQATVELKGGHRAAFLRVPATLDPGDYTLRITNADGLDTGDCSPALEVVAEGPPTLESIEPESQLPGRGVVCKGTDLGPAGPCRVEWTDAAGKTLESVGFANGFDRVFTHVPFQAGTGSAYDVAIVFRDDSTTADTGLLAYTTGTPAAPALDKLLPDAGPAGSAFLIRGRDLLVFGSKPAVGMKQATTVFEPRILFARPGFHGGPDELLVRVPKDAADGDYDVTVTVGGQVSNALTFTVGELDLTVESMKPDHQGEKGRLFPVRIAGTGFGLPGGRTLAVDWVADADGASRRGRVLFRSDRLLLVLPPGGRFEPLAVGTYEVFVRLGPASPSGPETSVSAGTYTVR